MSLMPLVNANSRCFSRCFYLSLIVVRCSSSLSLSCCLKFISSVFFHISNSQNNCYDLSVLSWGVLFISSNVLRIFFIWLLALTTFDYCFRNLCCDSSTLTSWILDLLFWFNVWLILLLLFVLKSTSSFILLPSLLLITELLKDCLLAFCDSISPKSSIDMVYSKSPNLFPLSSYTTSLVTNCFLSVFSFSTIGADFNLIKLIIDDPYLYWSFWCLTLIDSSILSCCRKLESELRLSWHWNTYLQLCTGVLQLVFKDISLLLCCLMSSEECGMNVR